MGALAVRLPTSITLHPGVMQLNFFVLELINQSASDNGGIGTPVEEGDLQGKNSILSFQQVT